MARIQDDVTYVTTAGNPSAWTFMTNELPLVHRALLKAGVAIHTLQRVTSFDSACVTLTDVYGVAERRLACRSLILVGMREPKDELYRALLAREPEFARAGIASVSRIGDALAPGAIVHAVHSGHRYAREFDVTDTVQPRGSSGAPEPPYARDFPLRAPQ